tara:strand:- start:75 stop:317 length:243 start_codon:yes stop_codon:yes gene_type:complete
MAKKHLHLTETDHDHEAAASDLDRYRHFLDGADMTEAQKAEFLETLWGIVGTFVGQAFGTDPVQTVLALREKDGAPETRK